MLFQIFLFCGKNWKEQVAHAPGSGQLSLLLALVSRAKGLVSNNHVGTNSYSDSQPAVRETTSNQKIRSCYKIYRHLSISKFPSLRTAFQ